MTPAEALAVLKAHIRHVHTSELYALDEDGKPIEPDGWHASDPSPAGDIARAWARELLEEAHADGHCGCMLCRG